MAPTQTSEEGAPVLHANVDALVLTTHQVHSRTQHTPVATANGPRGPLDPSTARRPLPTTISYLLPSSCSLVSVLTPLQGIFLVFSSYLFPSSSNPFYSPPLGLSSHNRMPSSPRPQSR